MTETLSQLKPCVFHDTKFISFLNGVNHISKIKAVYPSNEVINGCAYIVSSIQEPGHIENVGKIQRLSFGKINSVEFDLEEIMKAAEIDVICDENIESIVWGKFIFLSPIATITSYYQKPIGEILENSSLQNELLNLLHEVLALAQKKNIRLDENCLEKTIQKYHSLAFDTTTSMQRDFLKNPFKTEIESLTRYVVQECEKSKIGSNTYLEFYNKLNAR